MTASKIAVQIRSLMDEQGVTAYRIVKDTGCTTQSALSRFLSGTTRTMALDTIEAILDYLGCELVIHKRRGRKRTESAR